MYGIVGFLVLCLKQATFVSPLKHTQPLIIDSIFDSLFFVIEGSNNKQMQLSLIFILSSSYTQVGKISGNPFLLSLIVVH